MAGVTISIREKFAKRKNTTRRIKFVIKDENEQKKKHYFFSDLTTKIRRDYEMGVRSRGDLNIK